MKWQQIIYTCCMTGTFLFLTFVTVYADNIKSPAEILRQARQLEADESSDAKYFYEALIENYPKSREAASARQRLAVLDKTKKQKKAAAERREAAEREESRRREQYSREHACDHLYAGKPVTVYYRYNSIFGSSDNRVDAVIVGISPSQGLASAKITGGDAFESQGYGVGTIIERSCSSY